MKPVLFCFLLISTAITHAQPSATITIGRSDSVYSKILREKRRLWVSMPDTTSPDGIFYPQRYPVVYLLDGDESNFSTVAVMLRQMGGGGGNTMFPQMILVGIPNTDRNRDLTPTHATFAPMLDSASAAHTGGGENFISFLEKELMPHIDSVYPTAPYRLLIGHSFGGLMTMHILLHHTNLFNAYLASDPSMWWSDQQLLQQANLTLKKPTFTGRSLFLAMANTMPGGMDTIQVKKDTNFSTLHIRSILQLGHYLNAHPQNGLSFNWKYYPDYDHGSVSMIDEYDGLRALFKFYSYQIPFGEFFKPSYKGDTLIAAHYKMLSRQMGYTLSPPEQLLQGLAHQLRGGRQFDRAFYFLDMNIENYPKSFNAYGAMGDFYMAKGDRSTAQRFYEKASALKGGGAASIPHTP
ncbi:MAG TPA: alpha/beta hydrolase-fold protein [Puia sp.]|nr:alpha/beta hydrolase-fold protein [Puia sp.]